MPVFYRGDRALITQQVFETAQVSRLRYVIADLSGFYVLETSPEPAPAGRIMGLSALGASLLVVPIVGPASHAVAALAAAAFAVGGLVHLRRRLSVRWELVATYGGAPVILFASADRTEFEQVCRGLLRALECREGG